MIRRRSHGFTLVELIVVLIVSAALVPAIYLWWRTSETGLHEALAQTEAAEATRSVSEEIRRDLFTRRWRDAESLVLVGKSACDEVRYELDRATAVLFRRVKTDCGDDRALAAHVGSAARTPFGVELVFERHLAARGDPHRTRMRIAGGDGSTR